LRSAPAFGPGAVTAVDTRLNRRTRAALVRAEVQNQNRLLRPGMLIKVVVDRGEPAALVEALQEAA